MARATCQSGVGGVWGGGGEVGEESFKKQLLSPRICGEGDGWHCSYFKNCRKRRGAIARQREGRRLLGERASQEEFMKGVENAVCVCCLQDLSADTVSL